MAAGRREQMRMHAFLNGCWFAGQKRVDFDRYIRTGELGEKQQYPLPDTPLIRKEMAKMRLYGQFVEDKDESMFAEN